jgi:hypothetical protein
MRLVLSRTAGIIGAVGYVTFADPPSARGEQPGGGVVTPSSPTLPSDELEVIAERAAELP